MKSLGLSPRRIGLAAAVLIAIALVWFAVRPAAVLVDVASVKRSSLRVTVDEEGMTRVRRRFVLSAPVAGRLEPCVLDEGETVDVGSVVARLYPLPLDARGRAQASARLQVATEARRAAEADVARATAALEEAQRYLARTEPLAQSGGVSEEEIDQARTAERTANADLQVAQHRALAADYQIEEARAALMESDAGPNEAIEIRSPIPGRVLLVHEECERVLQAGEPIVDVGDLSALEIVADILSADAVRVTAGDPIEVVEWGGSDTLRATVRLVEPAGFTKVSPLGVEEQRVNVIGDLAGPTHALGDRYRIEVRIVVWQSDDVLTVPTAALYRSGEGWMVFVLQNDRARARAVEIGQRGSLAAEVVAGLAEDERVVLHPPTHLNDGDRIKAR